MMPQTTVFHHVHTFDGARMLPADTVVVQESTIIAVGSDLALPTGATVIDGTGRTLLPGLIDAHTHTFESTLQQALIFGVTTELDMLTDWHLAKRLKRLQVELHMQTPRYSIFRLGRGTALPSVLSPKEMMRLGKTRISSGAKPGEMVWQKWAPCSSSKAPC